MRSLYYLIIGIALAVLGVWMSEPLTTRWGVNPDPVNHTHADFAVWLRAAGRSEGDGDMAKLDFSGEEYMSGTSHDAASHPMDGLRQYLHLHDGNGHVIHRHKPGLSLRDFFVSVGLTFQNLDFTNNDHPRSCSLEEDQCTSCVSWEGQMHCSGEWARTLRMFVNGKEMPLNVDYVFNDGDKILIVDAVGDEHVERALREMTNDACLYSKTCPWRGEPPAENCIADPEVPCTE